MGRSRHGGYHSVEVKVRVKTDKVTEDACERTPKKALAPLFDELTSSRGLVLQTGHGLSEETEVAGVIILMQVGDALFADGVQGPVGPAADVSEHQGALAPQRHDGSRHL